jgi:hypothetical protein
LQQFCQKLAVLRNLSNLFEQVFAPRCAPELSAGSQDGSFPINTTCYMFWDVTPISVWNTGDEAQAYYFAIADVMRRCLRSSNPAVIESALHGLGHLTEIQPKISTPIIDNFLKNNNHQEEKLIHYAKSARAGMVL